MASISLGRGTNSCRRVESEKRGKKSKILMNKLDFIPLFMPLSAVESVNSVV